MNSKYEDKILTEIAKEMGLKPEVINSVIKTTNRFLIKEIGEGSIDEIDKLQTICLPVLGKFIPKKNLKKWSQK
jgi:hypothetical protein